MYICLNVKTTHSCELLGPRKLLSRASCHSAWRTFWRNSQPQLQLTCRGDTIIVATTLIYMHDEATTNFIELLVAASFSIGSSCLVSSFQLLFKTTNYFLGGSFCVANQRSARIFQCSKAMGDHSLASSGRAQLCQIVWTVHGLHQ